MLLLHLRSQQHELISAEELFITGKQYGHNAVLLLLRLVEDFLPFQSAQSLGQEMPSSAFSQSCFLKV